MSRAKERAEELLAEYSSPINVDWTLDDVLGKRDGDKAAEIIRLVTEAEGFMPFVIQNGSVVSKSKKKARTDVSSAKKMLSIRKTLKEFERTEANDNYVGFWEEMLEINDYYFLLFVKDLYDLDNDLMDGFNKFRREHMEGKEKDKAAKELAKKKTANQKKILAGMANKADIQQDFVVAVAGEGGDFIEQFSDEEEAKDFIENYNFQEGQYGAILTPKKDGTWACGARKVYTA